MVASLIVYPQEGPLLGSVPVPSDTNLLLSRVAVAALSRGITTLRVAYPGQALLTLLAGMRAVGVESETDGTLVRVFGAGLDGVRESDRALDARGEAWSAALLLGLLAARPFSSEIYVDASVAETLGAMLVEMGLASREPLSDGVSLHLLAVAERVPGFDVGLSGVLPWVKQALLLLALRAGSPSLIEEQVGSADHLERALFRSRAPVSLVGSVLSVHPPRDADALAPAQYDDIGSSDLAAFVGAAALLIPGGAVTARAVGSNPTRADFWNLCRLRGGTFGLSPLGDRQGEPYADFSLSGGPIGGVSLAGESAFRLGEGIAPLLALLARARGTSELTDVALTAGDAGARGLSRMIGYLRVAGVEATMDGGTLRVVGTAGARFRGLEVTTGGDARLVLFATLLGLFADRPSVIDDVDCLRGTFPRWVGTLRALGAKIEVREES